MKTATDANVHMKASNRFSLNQQNVKEVDVSDRIIPTAYETVVSVGARTFDIVGITWANAQLLGDLIVGATDLLRKLGVNSNGDHQVTFNLGLLPQAISGSESYTMEIKTSGTKITATDGRGLFHGLMSFLNLLDITKSSGEMMLKEMIVYDKPRFDYRGHQVDVARNFHSKEAIEKTIDAMALWKVSGLIWNLHKFCYK